MYLEGTFIEKGGDVKIQIATQRRWPLVVSYRDGVEVHGLQKLKDVLGYGFAITFVALIMMVCIGLPLAFLGLCVAVLGLTQAGLAKLAQLRR